MLVKNYRSDLLVRLADPEYAAHYLKAALEATLEDSDRVFRQSLAEALAAVLDEEDDLLPCLACHL
ncbi:MAG: hypothetical protein AAFQ89_05340 [Cyanobacteria bacterium J06626_18]